MKKIELGSFKSINKILKDNEEMAYLVSRDFLSLDTCPVTITVFLDLMSIRLVIIDVITMTTNGMKAVSTKFTIICTSKKPIVDKSHNKYPGKISRRFNKIGIYMYTPV